MVGFLTVKPFLVYMMNNLNYLFFLYLFFLCSVFSSLHYNQRMLLETLKRKNILLKKCIEYIAKEDIKF